MDTHEFEYFHNRLNELEVASLKQRLQRLEEENECLRAQVQQRAELVPGAKGVFMLDVDELCKFLADLDDEKSASFLLSSVLKVSSGSFPAEDLKRLLDAVFTKHPGAVNILSKGDLNVETLNNLGVLLSADKIASLAV